MRFKVVLTNLLCGATLAGLGFGFGVHARPASVVPPIYPPVQTTQLHLEPSSTTPASPTCWEAEVPPPNQEFF